MSTLEQVLKSLDQYHDKVLIHPLTDLEIEHIQSKFQKPIPDFFIQFLKSIGLKQDLVLGVLTSVNRFEDISEFIGSEDYFQFGDNGGEDYWLLRFGEDDDISIYEFDCHCDFEIRTLGKTFEELLVESLHRVKIEEDKLVPNERKEWHVQFSIHTNTANELMAELSTCLPISLIKKPEYAETSPAGVICRKGEVEIFGNAIPLKEQSYPSWQSPCFSFNWNESVSKMKSDSEIKAIESALKASGLRYNMIDYGILNKD